MKQRLSTLIIFSFIWLVPGLSVAQLPDFTELVKDSAPAVVNI